MTKPVTLLISAQGGEGGGVLTGWIVAAARAEGLAVQATSVPGVAQRTGATTYYIEMAARNADGRAPVFALFPVAGQVDIAIASELLEAGRVVSQGYVTRDRTTVLASNHRIYSMTEKTAMGDGRLDSEPLQQVISRSAKRALIFDMNALARQAGVPISAVMLGVLAATDVLPIRRAAFADAIRAGGLAVERNLTGFTAAANRVAGPAPATVKAPAPPAIVDIAVDRLTRYQDRRYADLYRKRLEPFAAGDPELRREVARHLAIRMAYEDVIRVAQIKGDPARFERIRGELGLTAGDPFHVVDFLKPGLAELCDLLPGFLARPLLALGRRRPALGLWHIGLHLRSTTILGYLRLWLLARLRVIRRLTWRYGQEQATIERWLDTISRAAVRDAALAREVAALAGLVKGYAETSSHGRDSFRRILADLVEPILAGREVAGDPAALVAEARKNALADPQGTALDGFLRQFAT